MTWTTACRIADLLLSRYWPQLEAVAAGTYRHGVISEDHAAELAGVTNAAPWTAEAERHHLEPQK
ncbi:hypothetical protein [Streptomyces sp. NPDC017964]|uniref:hypothetical protein n=1 Tax=Streptomyces sp. NPDC017964 TaxID=3365022 RepID=UPI0037B23BB9